MNLPTVEKIKRPSFFNISLPKCSGWFSMLSFSLLFLKIQKCKCSELLCVTKQANQKWSDFYQQSCFQQMELMRIILIFAGKRNICWDILPSHSFPKSDSYFPRLSKFIQIFQDTSELFLWSMRVVSDIPHVCLSPLHNLVLMSEERPEQYVGNRNGFCESCVSFPRGPHVTCSHEPRFNISQTSHCWISLYASNSFTASGLALHWRRHSPWPVGEKLWEWV